MKGLEEKLVWFHKAVCAVGFTVFPLFVVADLFIAPNLVKLLMAAAIRAAVSIYLLAVFLVADKIPHRVHHWLYPLNVNLVAFALAVITIMFREPYYMVGMLLVFFGGTAMVILRPQWAIINIAGLVFLGFAPPLIALAHYTDPEFFKLMLLYDAGVVALGIAANLVMWRNAKELVAEKERSAKLLKETERIAKLLAQKADVLLKGASRLMVVSHKMRVFIGSLSSEVTRVTNFAEEVSRSAEQVAKVTGQMANGSVKIRNLTFRSYQKVTGALSKESEAQGFRRKIFSLAEELERNFEELALSALQVQALAKRTKVLSVNASVEAARSGEPALAVVAEQIKGLATEVRETTATLAAKVRSVEGILAQILGLLKQYGSITSQALAEIVTIEELVSGVVNETANFARFAEEIKALARNQAVWSEEVAESLESIREAMGRLEGLADELVETARELESTT